ncbi:condensation domain-containing protein, partial [Xanthomonas bonasiae]
MSDCTAATGYPLSLQQSRSWRWQGACWCRSQCAVLIEASAASARERVRLALPRLVAAHEILRTRFVRPSGLKAPLQTVIGSAQAALTEADWSGEADWRASLSAFYAQALSSPQDANAPLLQVWWLSLGDDRAVLLVSASALCADGVGVLRLAQALLEGAVPDPDQTLQYIDVADELCAALESDHGREGLAHWSRQRALQWEDGLVSAALTE